MHLNKRKTAYFSISLCFKVLLSLFKQLNNVIRGIKQYALNKHLYNKQLVDLYSFGTTTILIMTLLITIFL